MASFKEIQKLFNAYEKNIQQLKIVEKELNQLDTSGFTKEENEIKKYIKDPTDIEKVSNIIRELKEKIKERNEVALLSVEKIKKEFLKNTHSNYQIEEFNKQYSEIQTLFSEKKYSQMKEKSKKLLSSIHDWEKNSKKEKNNKINKNKSLQYFPQELLSDYSPSDKLGEGGFARVYEVTKNIDGSRVALKIPIEKSREIGKSFVKELSNWLRLKHQNIVEIFDCNVYPVFLEMELCDTCLDDQDIPMEIEEACQIIFDISKGLKFAHEKGIIHRDLKPQNIMIKEGIPKISDWGLCKIIAKSSSSKDKYYFSPMYAAPEHISPKKFGKRDKRTDIWQLGVIFYELVTGKVPFFGDDFVEIASSITIEECPKPSAYNKAAVKVDKIIGKCLKKDKLQRYQNISELQKDLAIILKITYVDSLKKSQSQNDFSKSGFYCGELLKTMIEIENLPDSYKYANDLVRYVKNDHIKKELQGLIQELKERIENNLGVEEQLMIKVDSLVHRIVITR